MKQGVGTKTAAPEPDRAALRAARLVLALLAASTVAYDVATSAGDAGFSAADHFSYFTIESNLAAAAVLLAGALRDPRSAAWGSVRGAVTLCLAITGIVYAVLLSDRADGSDPAWISAVLHQVMPVALLLDWLADPPRRRVSYRAALVWLAIPAAYCAYSLIRGAIVGWYPYFFIDVTEPGGYGRVAVNALALALGFAVLAMVVTGLGNAAARLRRP